jgi:hypothetical protein
MSDEVWVDTDRMSTVLPQVNVLAEKTHQTRDGLLARLGTLYDAPGDDAAGRAFREQHDPMSHMVVGAMLDFVQITNGVVDGIHTMVRGYTATEEGNTVPHFDTPTTPHEAPKPPPVRP